MEDKCFLLFSYGSNSQAQLRARIENPNVIAYPACVKDMARVFCFNSAKWGDSGVASLAPCPGTNTYGSVVEINREEKRKLDVHEGGYVFKAVTIVILNSGDIEVKQAYTYIARGRPPLSVLPTEQYLCAIWVMLKEFYVMDNECIDIRSFETDGTVKTIKQWSHPGIWNLSLEALCVEVNARKDQHSLWVMPNTITRVVGKLSTIGVQSTSDLSIVLAPSLGEQSLNERLEASHQTKFGTDTMNILNSIPIQKTFIPNSLELSQRTSEILRESHLLADSVQISNVGAFLASDQNCQFHRIGNEKTSHLHLGDRETAGQVFVLDTIALQKLDGQLHHHIRCLVNVNGLSGKIWTYLSVDFQSSNADGKQEEM